MKFNKCHPQWWAVWAVLWFQEATLMFLVCFYFSSLESRNTWWEGGHFIACAFPGHGEQVKQVLQISISLCEILYKLCCLWIQLLGQLKPGWMAEGRTGVSHMYDFLKYLFGNQVWNLSVFQCDTSEPN